MGGVVLLLACGVGAVVLFMRVADGLPTASATPSTSSSTTTPTPTATRFAGDLDDLFMEAPADSSPWPDITVSGEMTVDELAEAFYHEPEEVAADLRRAGVDKVAATHWSTDDVDVLIEVYQFDRVAQARNWVRNTRVYGITDMEYEGAPQMDADAIWFSWVEPDESFEQAMYLVARGDLVCVVTVWDFAMTGHASAFDIAEEQFALLPAAS